MKAADVTIVIPVYNRSVMLSQALESCRRQTAQGFEVLIFDNCSTEDLRPVIQRFSNLMRVRYHRHATPVPPVSNFALSSEAVTTPYIKFLCSDDLLFPQAVERMLTVMRDAPGAAACIGGYVEFCDDNDMDTGGAMPTLRRYFRPTVPSHNPFSGWLRWDTVNCLFPSSILYDTQRFQKIGGFHTQLRTAIDWEIYLALLSRFPIVKVDEVVCAARLHAGQWLQEAKFTQGAQSMHDVLLLTSDRTNSHRARLGLPATQQSYLRHQTCWAALRNVLASGKERRRNFQLWRERIAAANMTHRLLLGALFWAAVKVGEKLIQCFRRRHPDTSVLWPDPAVQARTARTLREILDASKVHSPS